MERKYLVYVLTDFAFRFICLRLCLSLFASFLILIVFLLFYSLRGMCFDYYLLICFSLLVSFLILNLNGICFYIYLFACLVYLCLLRFYFNSFVVCIFLILKGVCLLITSSLFVCLFVYLCLLYF